ncbi:MAG: OmpA family protein [Deltaproteobacteria bacterium]|jgi:outer membrane protein OmpA-like peptidoglycan-associated protein|nr:OmpA family protein [Deltaproteobacteria bacterium]
MRKTFVALALMMGLIGSTLANAANAQTVNAQKLAPDQGLYYALAESNIPAMAALRDQGANPNITLKKAGLKPTNIFSPDLPIFGQPLTTGSWPILTWAVYLSQKEATNLLLRAGAKINGTDEYGATALHWAAWAGRHDLAQHLLNNGANCQAKDFKGRTPKDWAIMVSQVDMIRLLDSRSCRGYPEGDEDRDGVVDSQDVCPGTPYGAHVDARGCWVVAYATFFDLDRSYIKSQFLPHIRQAAKVLANNPDIRVAIVGHTDSSGSVDYNLSLGWRRAEAIMRELVRQGVDPSRLIVDTKGESEPIADNVSGEGRARNRRVELHVAQPQALANSGGLENLENIDNTNF